MIKFLGDLLLNKRSDFMSLCYKNENGEIVKVAESGGGVSTADQITYDNTTSEVEATNVQDAIDGIFAEISEGGGGVLYIQIERLQTSISRMISKQLTYLKRLFLHLKHAKSLKLMKLNMVNSL